VSAGHARTNEVVNVQMKELRRVVTGIDAAGKSYVAINGPPANIRESDGRGAAEFWITDATPADNAAPGDPAAERPPRLEPPAGGSVVRYFMVAPENKALSPAELEAQTAARFAAMGASHCRVDTSRHPSMHTTRTVDYIVVLSGRVTLLLDKGEVELKPFDVVVQRGTNHGWANRGDEPAVMAAILIDAKPL
jgi:mannose-6-phosphate isomerase-like protein (cupin superfamily)